MSKLSIWQKFRSLGIPEPGTAALMGNFEAESNCEACRVQGDYDTDRHKSHEYADAVNEGRISGYDFAYDGKGWGLYQLTYPSRKQGFFDYCRKHVYGIDSELAQCEYCYIELSKDYPKLLTALMEDGGDVYDLTCRVCKEFERPAYNNTDARYRSAKAYYEQYKGTAKHEVVENPVDNPTVSIPTTGCDVVAPILKRGCKGRAVYMVQCGLTDAGFDCGTPDGDFGRNTENAVIEMQKKYMQDADGIVDSDEWQILFQ